MKDFIRNSKTFKRRNGMHRLSNLLLAALFFMLCALPAAADEQPRPRAISVTGESEVLVAPDKVIITVGVETGDKVLTEAKKANDKLIAGLVEAALQFDIERGDIQTDYISIEPRYKWVNRNIIITLKDVNDFDELMSSLVAAGDIQVLGVQFQSSELRKYRDQARSMAVKAAFDKATAMAGELGQKVGNPIEVNEQGSRWYSPYTYWNSYRRSNPFNSQNVVETPNSDETPVAAGKISVTASVSARFELE
jgi:uncharacterized protein YggE